MGGLALPDSEWPGSLLRAGNFVWLSIFGALSDDLGVDDIQNGPGLKDEAKVKLLQCHFPGGSTCSNSACQCHH